MKNFYITTTLPYVNAEPHVGFAMELIRADALARFKKLQGFEVFFNTGTDEHGQKLYTEAEKLGKPIKEYVDDYAAAFKGLKGLLGISDEVHFVRTTNEDHKKAAQEFWKICEKNGYIYKGSYQAKYCVGCELEKTDSELVDGKCPLHPNREIELISEENYFFKWSVFGDKLLAFYEQNPTFVVPDFRFNEIKSFVKSGLQDFSISRQKSKMSWGVEVPGDPEHVMYVWFDALVNYISTLGWPKDTKKFNRFWQEGKTIQICGKDNLRQQTAMWQAMLMAAGIKNTSQVYVEGFINGEGGVKMSKSLGNVINPADLVSEYGTEALRYYVLGELSSFEDSPMSKELFKDAYNAKLANGIGNLTSRILKMAISYDVELDNAEKNINYYIESHSDYLKNFNFKGELDEIWRSIQDLDEFIQREEPFKKIKLEPDTAKKDVKYLLYHLLGISLRLEPFLPETSKKIVELIKGNKMPSEPLFQRKD